MDFSSLNFKDNEPIYIQIQNYIKDMIESGIVAKDSKMPSSRDLSKMLGVSRNSVIAAYEELELKSILYTIKGKGTFVANCIKKKEEKWKISWENKRSEYSILAEELDIVKGEIPYKKGIISFKSISPEGELFDMDSFKRAFLNRISVEGDKLLNYGYAKGYKPLMEYLLKYMEKKGVDTEGKDIMITNGFTEGLDLILTAFTNKGDNILVENPTHNTAIKQMKVNGLNIIGVKMNEDGIDINELKEKIKDGEIKFGYLIPSYHNPTGIVLNGEKRRKVYDIFKEYNVPIIEDGFSEELLYNNSHIAPIAALDSKSNGVVYISSFSKILFPGLRIGWIIGSKEVISTLESVKRCKNIHTSFLDQGILYEYLESGEFRKHIKRVRKFYKSKYEFTIECIKKYINPEFIWGEGGLHLYIGFNDINTDELLLECYKRNVIFMRGNIFSVDGSIKNTLRLGISRVSEEEIEKGIKIIGEVIKDMRRFR